MNCSLSKPSFMLLSEINVYNLLNKKYKYIYININILHFYYLLIQVLFYFILTIN